MLSCIKVAVVMVTLTAIEALTKKPSLTQNIFVVCLLVFNIKQYVKLQASWELPAMQTIDSGVL